MKNTKLVSKLANIQVSLNKQISDIQAGLNNELTNTQNLIKETEALNLTPIEITGKLKDSLYLISELIETGIFAPDITKRTISQYFVCNGKTITPKQLYDNSNKARNEPDYEPEFLIIKNKEYKKLLTIEKKYKKLTAPRPEPLD